MSVDFSLSQWAMQVLPQQYRNDVLMLFLDGISQIIPQNIIKMLTRYNRFYIFKFSSNPIYDASKNVIQWKFNFILNEIDDIPVGFSVLTIIINPIRTSCKGYLQLDCGNQLLNTELIQIKAIIANVTKIIEFYSSDVLNKIGSSSQSQMSQFQQSQMLSMAQQYSSINSFQQSPTSPFQFPPFSSNNPQPKQLNTENSSQDKIEQNNMSPLGMYSQNPKSIIQEKKEDSASVQSPIQKINEEEKIKIDALVGDSGKKNEPEPPVQFDMNTSIEIPKIPSIKAATTRIPISNSKKTTSDGNKNKKTKE